MLPHLETVIPWLEAHELTLLWLSGDKNVQSMLTRADVVTEIRLKAKKDWENFPNILRFPFARQIRSLRLKCRVGYNRPSVSLYHIDDLPKTLQSIEIHAMDGAALFSPPNEPTSLVSDLDQRLPHLEKLRIYENGDNTWIGADMNRLPKTLLKLEFSKLLAEKNFTMSELTSLMEFSILGFTNGRDGQTPPETLSFSSFPPSLTKLDLSPDRFLFIAMFKTLRGGTTTGAAQFSKLFPHLTSLSTGYFVSSAEVPELLQAFPPTLKHLSIILSHINDSDVPLLPAGLQTLSLSQHVISGDHFHQLPRNLTWLELRGSYSTKHLIDLPQSLTKLSIGISEITSVSLGALPRTLLDLHLIPRTDLCEGDLAMLPPGLTKLTINPAKAVPTDSLHVLPRSLLHLTLDSLPNASEDTLKSLPRGLASLNLPNTQRLDSIEDLPPHLIEFQAPLLTSLTLDDIIKLPRHLRVLITPLFKGVPASAMQDMPPSLSVMCINVSNVLTREDFYLAFSKRPLYCKGFI